MEKYLFSIGLRDFRARLHDDEFKLEIRGLEKFDEQKNGIEEHAKTLGKEVSYTERR